MYPLPTSAPAAHLQDRHTMTEPATSHGPSDRPEEVDVLVVGYGAAGAAAASVRL